MTRFLIIIFIICLVLIWFNCFGECGEIPDNSAIRAIIGEASNQGYRGMLHITVGIRNRGHLRGVYGLNAKHVDKEPAWVWALARKAWAESEYNRFHNADHWESTDFKIPKWSKGMIEVCKYKKHIFYWKD